MFSGTTTTGIAQGKAAAPAPRRPAKDGRYGGAGNLFSSSNVSYQDEHHQIDYRSRSNVMDNGPMRHRSAPSTVLVDLAAAVEDNTSNESMIMEFLYEPHNDDDMNNVCGNRSSSSSHMMIINRHHDGTMKEEADVLKQTSSSAAAPAANYIIDDDRNHVVVAGNNDAVRNYSGGGSGGSNLSNLAVVLPVPDNSIFKGGFRSRRGRDDDVASIFRPSNTNSSSNGKKANTFLKHHHHHHLTDEDGINNSNNFNVSHERSLQDHAAATTTVNVDAHGIIYRSTKRLRASTKDGTCISLFPENTTSVSFDYQDGISAGRVGRLYRHSIWPSMFAAASGSDQTDAAAVDGYTDMYLQDSVGPLFQARAKRGCATHPRSIAERVRRTRINERIRKLQKLFPDLDKQTSTSDMLDMALDYIRNLQYQVKRLADIRENCTCSGS